MRDSRVADILEVKQIKQTPVLCCSEDVKDSMKDRLDRRIGY